MDVLFIFRRLREIAATAGTAHFPNGGSRTFFVICSLGLIAIAPLRAEAFTSVVPFYEWVVLPSNALKNHFATLTTEVGCYDDFTLQLLACPYTFELVGVDNLQDPLIANQLQFYPPFTELEQYGGHEHDQATHPFYILAPPAQSPITVTGGSFAYLSPTKVKGNSFFTVADLTFTTPEVAGTIWQRADLGTPPGWYCL